MNLRVMEKEIPIQNYEAILSIDVNSIEIPNILCDLFDSHIREYRSDFQRVSKRELILCTSGHLGMGGLPTVKIQVSTNSVIFLNPSDYVISTNIQAYQNNSLKSNANPFFLNFQCSQNNILFLGMPAFANKTLEIDYLQQKMRISSDTDQQIFSPKNLNPTAEPLRETISLSLKSLIYTSGILIAASVIILLVSKKYRKRKESSPS
jgi:hypothetical protein